MCCVLTKKLGVLSLLDEESRFPKGTDQTLLEKLHKAHEVCMHHKATNLLGYHRPLHFCALCLVA